MSKKMMTAMAFVITMTMAWSQVSFGQGGCGVPYYESCGADCYQGCDVGCGGGYGDVCCGDACEVGYCGGCCGGGCGILPFLSEVVSVALTPVHWVASLFSCGTFADCGCAPPYEQPYSDPCDCCGNYVGDGYCDYYNGFNGGYNSDPNGYGYDYYSKNQPAKDYQSSAMESKYASAANSQYNQRFNRYANPSLNNKPINENSDYLNYSKIETLGQKKMRREREVMVRMQQAPNSTMKMNPNPQIVYSEQPIRTARPMTNGAPAGKAVSGGAIAVAGNPSNRNYRSAMTPNPRTVR